MNEYINRNMYPVSRKISNVIENNTIFKLFFNIKFQIYSIHSLQLYALDT